MVIERAFLFTDTTALIPPAFTPESIRDRIYKILAYYVNHIGIIAAIIYLYLPIFLSHL